MNELIPSGARVEHLDLDGGRVRLLRGGAQGLPLVLLHGGGTNNSAVSWCRLFEPLSAEHPVIAPDLPGHGGTTGIEPMGGADTLADFVARIMDELDLTDAVVMGVSVGGETALNLALRQPRLVRALVLISPSGLLPIIVNRAAQTGAWLYARQPEWVLLLQSRLISRFGIPLRSIVHDPAVLPHEVITEIQREARRPRAGLAFHRYNRASIGRREMNNNLLSVVERVTVPALFFHGEHDAQQPPETSRNAAERMPNARRILVPGCGHWAHLEAHDQFLSEVTEFLATVE